MTILSIGGGGGGGGVGGSSNGGEIEATTAEANLGAARQNGSDADSGGQPAGDADVAADVAAAGKVQQGRIGVLEVEEFRQHAHRMVDFIADYFRDIEQFPVRSQVEPGYLSKLLPSAAPLQGEPLEDVLKDISRTIIPGITHWQSPSFFGYFPANCSTAGFLGDMMGAAFNVIGFSWISSPAATELESLALDWLARLLLLPSAFISSESGGHGGGVIQGSASEAVIVAMLAARKQAMDRIMAADKAATSAAGEEAATSAGAAMDRLVLYCSDQAHSCVIKAAMVAGIERANVRILPTAASDAYALSPAVLQEAVEKDEKAGLVPFFFSATVGTTSSTAVDPIAALGEICRSHGMWFHIDAAYAGTACICPEFRPFLTGVELADSFCMNAHKWMLTNFDCSCLWVKNSSSLVNALSIQPEYLRNKASEKNLVVDYKDWQLPLGRRFRALKLWMVLRMYGVEGLQSYVRNHVHLAERFEAMVRADERFEVVTPRTFALVCFRLKPPDGNESRAKTANEALLEAVNSTGNAFFTHTVLSGRYTLRMAIGATRTEERHVTAAWKLIQSHATDILKAQAQAQPKEGVNGSGIQKVPRGGRRLL